MLAFGRSWSVVEELPYVMVRVCGMLLTFATVNTEAYPLPVTAWGKTSVDCAADIGTAALISSLPLEESRSRAASASDA